MTDTIYWVVITNHDLPEVRHAEPELRLDKRSPAKSSPPLSVVRCHPGDVRGEWEERRGTANVVSKRKYRGLNPILLDLASETHGFSSKWWGTFQQWKAMEGG